jgi:acyl carrier protein
VQLLIDVAKIPADRISDHATIDAELRMESVVIIEIQVALEDEYNIELDPIYLIELNEFGPIVDYVYQCAAESNGAER